MLTVQDGTYQLHAVVVHLGNTPLSGHYVAYVRRGLKWFLCDDTRVEPVPFERVRAVEAAMLFYARKTAGKVQRDVGVGDCGDYNDRCKTVCVQVHPLQPRARLLLLLLRLKRPQLMVGTGQYLARVHSRACVHVQGTASCAPLHHVLGAACVCRSGRWCAPCFEHETCFVAAAASCCRC
jgi:hypothetical protein